ncbi:Na+/H+ antiporter [Dictyobacter arantiisoli]|uniref:Na+/H+ antiporter n=1 Tax=Dictyobacter arantiisoli TaxID=2014874 RepID=A0A5A5T6I0_9CHLR|nr:Na+/H+ antiporter [Dictyobacter arantiisoli]GCF06992.1 Na+/H+ antiporter [Dictyobacter arantiisoli]
MPETITLIFFLFVAIVILAIIATRLNIPYAIMLVIGGLLLTFIPGLPTIHIDPNLILFLFLPPLIYASASQISWREFRSNLRPILLLSIGLVLATTVIVAVVAHSFLALPWGVAFVLGAIISPTDAITAGATAKSVGLSRRIVTILEGESMVNDATGLVIYRFALASVVTASFSIWQAGIQFVGVSIGGVIIGLVIAWPIVKLHHFLNDAVIEVTVSLLTPYAAYLLAEALGLSGVLATLAAGLYISRHSSRFYTSETRLPAHSYWNILVFQFNGLVFLLIGLELRSILDSLGGQTIIHVIWPILLISITAIVVRIAWVLTSAYLPHLINRRMRINELDTQWDQTVIIAWTGLRGSVALAAALALPLALRSGSLFPERNLLIVITFGVILITLVGQGLALTPIIRLLKLNKETVFEQEMLLARRTAVKAALKRLQALKAEKTVTTEFIQRLQEYYEQRLHTITIYEDSEKREYLEERLQANSQFRREIINVERHAVITLRDHGQIDDEILHAIEHELDLEEQRFYL